MNKQQKPTILPKFFIQKSLWSQGLHEPGAKKAKKIREGVRYLLGHCIIFSRLQFAGNNNEINFDKLRQTSAARHVVTRVISRKFKTIARIVFDVLSNGAKLVA